MPALGLPRNANILTAKPEWGTPLPLFGYLDSIHHFYADLAATRENALCYHYYSNGGRPGLVTVRDGSDYHCMGDLIHGGCYVPEFKTLFMNPDYSRGVIDKMMLQALVLSVAYNNTVVCLVPFCAHGWFKKYAMQADTIEMIGRVKYVGYYTNGELVDNSPSYDSCVVTFRPKRNDHTLSIFPDYKSFL
jgi:hypothetical protein